MEKEKGAPEQRQVTDVQKLSQSISFMLSGEKKHDKATGLHCLCQHFAIWYEDIKNGRLPDFGAPCQSCQNQETCLQNHFPWMKLILPILEEQGVAITLVRPEK